MGFLKRFFGKKEKQAVASAPAAPYARFVNEPTAALATWGGTAAQSDIAVSCIDSICRNVSKLKGSHVIDKKPIDDKLTRLLQIRPNEIQSASDFLYKISAIYFLQNNSFVFVERDDMGNVNALYPVDYQSAQFMRDTSDRLYIQFIMRDGKKRLLPYCDLIHIRRHYNTNRLIGSSNRPLNPALQLAESQNASLVKSIEKSAHIRGILKYNQIANDELIENEKAAFLKDFFSMDNDGGIVVTDSKSDFVPIEMKPVVLDEGQTKQIRDKIYSYFGVTEEIVNSSYDEDRYSAFFESVVEPFALQLSLEMTSKLFTVREIAFGNRVLYESGRLQFSSNKTKVKLIKELLPTGLLTINQALEILNLPCVSDGDRRIQSLNFIDLDKATQYQLAKAGRTTNNEEKE